MRSTKEQEVPFAGPFYTQIALFGRSSIPVLRQGTATNQVPVFLVGLKCTENLSLGSTMAHRFGELNQAKSPCGITSSPEIEQLPANGARVVLTGV